MKPTAEQLSLLLRGVEKVFSEEELRRKLAAGRALRVKLGADPTAPDLHLGHGVVLEKLRQFQDLGHKAVLIIGDYTARIGDPTGQNATRPMLDAEQIERNARTYFEQAGKVLETSPEKLEIRRNSEWLVKMSFADVIRLASQMTVAQMLERDTFEKRHRTGEPIGVHEFLYPLMQGRDSVAVRADIELGGTDQTFNNLVGRELQKDDGQEPQVVMILPILEGLDGVEKMSKSKGNYIGISEPAGEIFGKTMSISDELMWRWYALLLAKSAPEIAALKAGHPMEAKKDLAEALAARFSGAEAARAARRDFEKKFSARNAADTDLPVLRLDLSHAWSGPDLALASGSVSSRSEAYRLAEQGGLVLDGARLADPKASVKPRAGAVLKIGKKRFFRLADAS
ncbi:MAG: tyrosine--tRNA ligase [Verrucomicrobiae bacterium]|nr:tyrosine--tRNA ligase [Verrucomicrobiae bacterium]